MPAALRKDLWHPMARITFPEGKGTVGLSAFQKLREYRKRHELEWELKEGDHIFWDPKGREEEDKPGTFQPGPRRIKERNKLLSDQKANSIADIAAVLNRLAAPMQKPAAPVPEGGDTGSPAPTEEVKEGAEPAEVNTLPNIGLIGEGSGTKVEVLWRDLHDAEFAETWANNIAHGMLPTPNEEAEKEIRTYLETRLSSEAWEAMTEEQQETATRAHQAALKIVGGRSEWEALPERQKRGVEAKVARFMKARQTRRERRLEGEAEGPALGAAERQAAAAAAKEEKRTRYAEGMAARRAAWDALSEAEKQARKDGDVARRLERQAAAEAAAREAAAREEAAAARRLAKQAEAEAAAAAQAAKQEKRVRYEEGMSARRAAWEALSEQAKQERIESALARKRAHKEADRRAAVAVA